MAWPRARALWWREDRAQAEAALATLRGRLVIEEFLRGEEVSFIALCDGRDVVPLAPPRITKPSSTATAVRTPAAWALTATPRFSPSQADQILNYVIYPTVEATAFTGFLYAGMMMTADGPKVLEFNVRLGDPETQPLMHRMQSDFLPALLAAAEGRLAGTRLEWRAGPSVCVVMASAGYPGAYESGKPIDGIAAAEALGTVVSTPERARAPRGSKPPAAACLASPLAVTRSLPPSPALPGRRCDPFRWRPLPPRHWSQGPGTVQ
jgi:phosphoribosylamine--glycine ligase